MGLRTDLTDAIEAEAEAAEAYAEARNTRIAARTAAVASVQASTGRVPHVIDNGRLDREMVHLMASHGCVALFEGDAAGGRTGFLDETHRSGSPVVTGTPDTAEALADRWEALAEQAGIPDA